MLERVVTRFRGYQLACEGSSFSYYAGGHFTLIEARLNKQSTPSVLAELGTVGKTRIDALHITSWDQDHCNADELNSILADLAPRVVEYPGYAPHTDSARACLRRLLCYEAERRAQRRDVTCRAIDPAYIKDLGRARELAYRDVFYHPRYIRAGESNNNSTVKLFRRGSFNVASLGDVEDGDLGAWLRRCRIFRSEVDILILAHHGADNGFTTKSFLRHVRPTVAVCSSDYDDKFQHPKAEIRRLLFEAAIPIFTTKTGDILVASDGGRRFTVTNLIGDSTQISSRQSFLSKKGQVLRHNEDTIRNIYRPSRRRFPF